jgi:hypothetical protein
MRSGRSPSGSFSEGEDRPKASELTPISDLLSESSIAAIKPVSLRPDAPEIDSAWDEEAPSASTNDSSAHSPGSVKSAESGDAAASAAVTHNQPALQASPILLVKSPVKPESGAKISAKPASKSSRSSDSPQSKSTRASDKPRSWGEAAKAVRSDRAKSHFASEGFDSESSIGFFASNSALCARPHEIHEHEELLVDEQHLRSISPEVRARRERYRVIVLGLVIALTLLLLAAIALRFLHRH